MRTNWVHDIEYMHRKFGVNPVVREFDKEKLKSFLEFRIKFLQEELDEMKKADNADDVVDALIDLAGQCFQMCLFPRPTGHAEGAAGDGHIDGSGAFTLCHGLSPLVIGGVGQAQHGADGGTRGGELLGHQRICLFELASACQDALKLNAKP